jgi:hypothetical protein
MRRIVLLALGVSLLACSGLLPGGKDEDTDTTDVVTDTNPPPDTDTDTTTDPPTPTGDTGPNPPGSGFEPYAAYMNASLVWDSATNSVRSLNLGGGSEVPSYIEIVIGSQAFADSTLADPYTLTDEYCVVDLLFPDGPAPQSALDTATTFRVVDHSGDVADVITTCDPAQFPMDAWLGAGVDLVDTLLNAPGQPWAIGVGQLSARASADLNAVNATAGFFDVIVGGRVFNSTFFFGEVIVDDGWVTRPFRVDPTTFGPVYDGAYLDFIPPAQVSNGTNLATGWYDMFPVYGVQLQQ